MCAVVTPDKVDAFLAVCAKWEVQADVIGEVTDGGRLTIDLHGETVLDVPPRSVAHDGPVYQRPLARPAEQDALQADTSAALPRPAAARAGATCCAMIASPNLCSRAGSPTSTTGTSAATPCWRQPADAGIVRVRARQTGASSGVAMATDCNGRYTMLDPYAGRPARAGRGLPQRRHHRGGAAGRHRLPELRLARRTRR